MKRVLSILLLVGVLFCGSLSACTVRKQEDDGKISVVATIFPAYDFAAHVCGEAATVTMLLPPGGESHSYEPTAQDLLRIQNCDLFIYNGGESDAWVEKILNAMEEEVPTLKMMDCVRLLEEGHEGHAEDEHETDEHVWTAPENAIRITDSIQAALCDIDPLRADIYTGNADAYITELETLDQDFRSFFASAGKKPLVFGDRFPLIYFTEAYGIAHHAAFPGCAEHAEPSAARIAELIRIIKEEEIPTVYYIEFSSHTIADSIADATGARTALFYTCHNVSKQQLEEGVTYVSLMRENLSTLENTF